MSQNPFVNALLAIGYICIVASFMYFGPKYLDQVDSVIVPITMLSLFVLSASVMAVSFFLRPLLLCFENKKEEALANLLKMIGTFAIITIFLLFTLFFFGINF